MIEKFKAKLGTVKGKVVCALSAAGATLGIATPVLAAEGDSEFLSGIRTVWTQITSELNVGNIVSIIGICIGACLVAVLFWFGLRYVSRKIQTAVKRGKFSA